MYLIFIPLEVYAEVAANLSKANKRRKVVIFAKSVAGITTCMDPTALPIQKVVACIKPCCAAVICFSGGVAQSDLPKKVKIVAWGTTTFSLVSLKTLEFIETKALNKKLGPRT